MITFSKDHVVILPHAEEYRETYDISVDEVLDTLNDPEVHVGVSEGRDTVEKTIGKRRVYIYFYKTLPLQGKPGELYAIVDFVGFSDINTLPTEQNP